MISRIQTDELKTLLQQHSGTWKQGTFKECSFSLYNLLISAKLLDDDSFEVLTDSRAE